MSKSPIASVVLPVYNAAPYLGRAIESILQQSFTDLELLLVNDGSEDDSLQVIASFHDPRIVLIDNKENKGLIFSLNAGIERSRGKYIVRMDADDISMPQRIEKQIRFMETHPEVGAAGCSYYAFTERSIKKVHAIEENEVLRSLLLFNSSLCHPATVIRKETLRRNAIRYDQRYPHAEDYDLWVQLSKVSKLGNVPDFLFKYRRHDQQVTRMQKKGVTDAAQQIRIHYLRYLGFKFTEQELETHYRLATNQLVNGKDVLEAAERWLLKLVDQNAALRSIEPKHFNYFMGKTWYDTCGMTNLGMLAYKHFFRSPLAKYFPLANNARTRLLGKCLIRRYKRVNS